LSEQEAIEMSIDLDLGLLSGEEIEGGWRSLCGMILLRTSQELGLTAFTKAQVESRRHARKWLFGQGALVTFGDCCEACNLDRRSLLNQIVEYADTAAGRRRLA